MSCIVNGSRPSRCAHSPTTDFPVSTACCRAVPLRLHDNLSPRCRIDREPSEAEGRTLKIVGYQTPDGVKIGRLISESELAPLCGIEQFWANPDLAILGSPGNAIDATELKLVPPVPPAARVLCVGLNYPQHVAEGAFECPTHPSIFGRWTRSLTVSGTPAPVPVGEQGLDWEGELAVIIGQKTKYVGTEEALLSVFGYSAFNDLTCRRAQHRTTQWTVGKNGDSSGPMSEIVTAQEVGDPGTGLRIVTSVNGEIVQDGNTADMIFSVGEILSHLSETMTLYPGDLVITGTPDGVGYTRRPPRFLHPGDEVTVDIERVGSVRTPIVAESDGPA
jgi:2,4-didehydro-3-deoxy-L-rhamnonate hydrolase